MPNNKLSDLNDHLFMQLERLGDDDMDDTSTRREVQKASAISKIASQVIAVNRLSLEALRLVDQQGLSETSVPEHLRLDIKKTPE